MSDHQDGVPRDEPAGVGGRTRDEKEAVSRAGRALRERWFACSNALGWSAAAEWPDPSVDEVCEAIVSGVAGPAFDRVLGAWAMSRARAGIGLAETLTDLAALHTAICGALGELLPHEGGDIPGTDGSTLVRVVSLAWADVACGELSDTAVHDPLSGLASGGYLRTRLSEIYDAARARGTRVGDDHGLVVVAMSVVGWSRIAPLTIVGEAARVVFDAGETIAALGRSTVVVLAPRDGLGGRVKVLRRLLERRLPPAAGLVEGPTVRVVGLPAGHEGIDAVLERLLEPPAAPAARVTAGSGSAGSGSAGSGSAGSGSVGAGSVGAGSVGSLPAG